MLTFNDIKNNPQIKTYIKKADEALEALGFTEHNAAHVTKCAEAANSILKKLGYDERVCELSKIAGYMHDIGNIVNRVDHAQSGAIMAFRILDKLEMDPEEIATIVSAIGNHDESTAAPINAVAAALILADKSDVRRSRVRNTEIATFDIHDRVNYAVVKSDLHFSDDMTAIVLDLEIDTEIASVVSYFEIFLNRMLLCKRAAEFLKLRFVLNINGMNLL